MLDVFPVVTGLLKGWTEGVASLADSNVKPIFIDTSNLSISEDNEIYLYDIESIIDFIEFTLDYTWIVLFIDSKADIIETAKQWMRKNTSYKLDNPDFIYKTR